MQDLRRHERPLNCVSVPCVDGPRLPEFSSARHGRLPLIETYQELQREANEIAWLVSVWHFIEAEQRLLKLTKMKYPLRDKNVPHDQRRI